MHSSPLRRRPFRSRVGIILSVALTVGLLTPALGAQAEPAAATAQISSDTLRVEVSTEFPQVIGYTYAGGQRLTGNPDPLTTILINGESQPVEVTSIKVAARKARYSLLVPGLADTRIDAELAVKDNVLTFSVTKITESADVLIRTIEIPGQDLVTLSSTDEDPVIAASRTSVDRAKSGDSIEPVTEESAVDTSQGSAYVLASTADLAAAFESNSLYDSGTSEATMDNSRFLRRGTKAADGSVSVGISSGQWLYRAEGSDQIEELPSFKVALTDDVNADAAVDWQDAAIAMRDIAVMPSKGEDVKDKVVQRIPFNFASQATHPFLRTLDDTKRIAQATDGLGQSAVLKGFGSEGHDSANTDFADNYNTRAGGLEDLNQLLRESRRWNATYGIHINQTEAYPESLFFDEEMVDPKAKGWNWLDQSYYIDQTKDTLSGQLADRIKKFRKQTDKGLDMVYVDVYYQHGWLAERLQQELVENGFRVGSEWSDKLARNNTWAHWAVDENYGGAANKGINSQIQRFIFNGVRDTWNPHPLLGSASLVEFEGWTGQTDYNAFLDNVWRKNLPTKFLQQHRITRWDTERIEFTDGVTAHGTSTDDRVITVDDKDVAVGDAYLLPWDTLQGSGRTATKLYHYNATGGTTTWQLTGELAEAQNLDLYALSDTGREKITRLPVTDGAVTIEAEAGQAYVLTALGGKDELGAADFGKFSSVEDPGFNQADFSDAWRTRGDVSIATMEKGHRVAEFGEGAGHLRQQLGKLGQGTYSISAWLEVEPGKERTTTLAVDGKGVEPATQSIDRSTAKNWMAADEKHSSNFQRVRVLVDVTKDGARPDLTISVADGSARVRVDDVRVVETTRVEEPGAVVAENFEDVDQGWGPFVKGAAGGVTDPRTHLSERNEPYTQAGWNENVIDDVIDGQWSLKSNGENRNPDGGDGLVYRTTDATVPLTPGHRYKVSFDHQNSHAGEYAWAHGYDTVDGPVVAGQQDLAEQHGTDRLRYEFTAGQCGANWTGLVRTGGTGTAILTLDNLAVRDLGAVDEMPACATLEFDPDEASVYPGKANKITTRLDSDEPEVVTDVAVELDLPQGWTATPTTAATADELAPGESLETEWEVVPAEDATGSVELTAMAGYTAGGTERSLQVVGTAYVISPFAAGDTWASDQAWVSAENGWGPVERDRSNGEQGQGDGRPLTLQGETYEKGLGTHAESTIRYYTAGTCSAFTAEVGVDDAQPSRGSITFQVLADGTEVAASSGVLGADSPTESITADIGGAEFVELVVGDAGDGNGNDHGDWANAKFSCE